MLKLTTENFHHEALHATEPAVLVMATAPHCAACRNMKPNLEKVGKEFGLKVGTVDITDQPDLATALKVNTLPTTFIIVGHELKVKWTGTASYSQLRKEVKEALGA